MKHYRPINDRQLIADFSMISTWKSPLLIFVIYLTIAGIFYLNINYGSPFPFIFSSITDCRATKSPNDIAARGGAFTPSS